MGTRIAVIVGVLLTMVVVVINSPPLRDAFVTSRPVADTSLPTAQSMQGLRAATRLLDRERRLRQQDRDRIAARESSSRLAITAPAFAATLTWNDMEPIGVFLERLPDGVTGESVGRTGETREFRYDFPGGGAIILLARPCGIQMGLCVWAVDVEN